MIASDVLAGVVASAIAGLGGLRNLGGPFFCSSATAKDRELAVVRRLVAVDWEEARKSSVRASFMAPGRGLLQVQVADGAERIVADRAFSGNSPWAATVRFAAGSLRELQRWLDLTGSRICAKLRRSNTVSTPTSLRYIDDTR